MNIGMLPQSSFCQLTSYGDKAMAAQNMLCSIITCVKAQQTTVVEMCKRILGRAISMATLLTMLSHKITRRVVLAGLMKSALLSSQRQSSRA